MSAVTSKSVLYSRLGITAKQLSSFCDRWRVAELALFGSVLRDDFGQDSDIDVLVTYRPDAQRGLIEKITMIEEMEALTNRKVDIVSKKAMEKSRNWIRRRDILSTAEVVYVFLSHDYDEVDLDEVWSVITQSLPELYGYVQPLIPSN